MGITGIRPLRPIEIIGTNQMCIQRIIPEPCPRQSVLQYTDKIIPVLRIKVGILIIGIIQLPLTSRFMTRQHRQLQ